MKKCISILFLIQFLFSIQLTAQTSVDSLAAQLRKPTDSLTAAAIYDWLTTNIEYDHRFRYRRANNGDTALRQEPYNVVRFRRAVCIGYAKLFRELCRLNGIESVVVDGWAKSGGRFVEGEEHAWNVLKINGLWQFVDVTWGAGDVAMTRKYWLTDPSVFSENHLPHDPIWQLLASPKTLVCFQKNENCGLPFAENFAFRDSIAAFEQLDSTQKMYNRSLRLLRFNPDDLDAMRDLGAFFMQQAGRFYGDYGKIRLASTDKKRRLDNKKMALVALDLVQKNLEIAQDFYNKIINLARTQQYTDAHLNRDLIVDTLENLATERAFFDN